MDKILLDEHMCAVPFWKHLDKSEQALVLSRALIRSYRAGERVRRGSDDCLGFVYVVSGAMRAYLLSPQGQEVTLYLIREKECCPLTASCALSSVSFDTFVDAQENCTVIIIPNDVFSALIKNNIKAELEVYKITAERFSGVVAGLERLAFFSIEQRIASFLLDESAAKQQKAIHLTHEQIAQNISTAREVVTRALKIMSEKGLISLFRGGVELVDKQALYKLVN